MSDRITEREVRLQKLRQYSELFGNAFPAKSIRTHHVAEVFAQFVNLGDTTVTVAGRIRYMRDHGKLTFMHVEDVTGKLQLAISAAELGDQYAHINLYDVGDIIEASGTPFTTHAGEQSIRVTNLHLLSKALEPLPDKWHGLQDEEARYRKRYVDMIMHPELRDMFIKKSRFWNSMRSFLMEEGFVEVETPVLESTPGGADAEPFATHHNALDIDLYLRISMGELWQKRLMVGGFEKTFEIGRQFRNEGISPEHLQDYTQMEFYWAYADYNDSMYLVERMYKHVIQETFGTLQFTINKFSIDLSQPWEQIDYVATIQSKFNINVLTATDQELLQACQAHGAKVDDTIVSAIGRGRLIDTLWKRCRKEISGPAFLVNHPVEVSPLAKRQAADPRVVERYQVIIAGSEIGNGYSELNDPIDQHERFEEQSRLRESGDTEAQMHDADFVHALEVGMPPTSGFGVSERLFSFLVNKPIRECVMFPLLRPKDAQVTQAFEKKEQHEQLENNDNTLDEFSAGITRQAALDLMYEQVQDANLRKHMLATEALMKKLAERFGATSVEAWGIAGLLHDVDYENVSMEQHSLVGAEMLAERGVHPDIVNAVREHNFFHGIEANTLLSKSMQCLEQLTGLIMATTLVRPDKNIASVKVSSVKKKFKDKAFAKGVDRAWIAKCEEMLGLTLDESIQLCLEAMQGIAEDLELS